MRTSRMVIKATASFVAAFLLLLGMGVQGTAQEVRRDTTAQGLKRMTVDDYALWRSVGQTSLSPDGGWVTFAYSQREVDDSLFIRPLAGGEARAVL